MAIACAGDSLAAALTTYGPSNTIVCMSVDRISITIDPALGAAVRQAARRAKVSLSAWVAQASADRVRNDALTSALGEWEAEAGPLTQEELEAAQRALSPSGSPGRRAPRRRAPRK